jgi:hypothetical protein
VTKCACHLSIRWLVHHSKDLARRTFAAVHYMDDSGETGAKYTLIGGPIFAQKGFFAFHYEWDRIAASHNVELPIHMREFNRPNGRLAHLSNEQRKSLFHDLVYLINRNKLFSLTAVVDNLEFQKYFPVPQFRRYMGAAPLAFLQCALLNHILVRDHGMRPMAYMIARSDSNSVITDCYNFWKSYETRIACEHTGSLTFDDPSRVNALQAADMVAWANRRNHAGGNFNNGFEALELLTRYVESDVKPSIHLHFVVEEESTRKLAEILGPPKRKKGERVSLLGLISPAVREHLETVAKNIGEDEHPPNKNPLAAK